MHTPLTETTATEPAGGVSGHGQLRHVPPRADLWCVLSELGFLRGVYGKEFVTHGYIHTPPINAPATTPPKRRQLQGDAPRHPEPPPLPHALRPPGGL